MYKRPSKKEKIIRLTVVYSIMFFAIALISTFVIFFVLGFRFNKIDGQVEQFSLVQFKSNPSGANIYIDGVDVGLKTPSKKSIPAGFHNVLISKKGYKDWQKTINAKAGVISWLNYALLVPENLNLEVLSSYESLSSSLSSPKGHYILVQGSSNASSFNLVDISVDKIKTTELIIPSDSYSEAFNYGTVHVFNPVRWDDGERYVLIEHHYSDKTEWLVLDTQNVDLTQNISAKFINPISYIDFFGTSGDVFYVLSELIVYKFEMSSDVLPIPIITNVSSFNLFDEINTISYIANNESGRVVGIYRDGDDKPIILRNVSVDNQLPLNIEVSRYFNENYFIISEGKETTILSGNYPESENDIALNLKQFASFSFGKDVENISSSPDGKYIFVGSGDDFEVYDLEYQTLSPASVTGTEADYKIDWLDPNHLWMIRNGVLKISDFDSMNIYEINNAIPGQTVSLNRNGRYLYSFNKTDSGYQLQRVRLILP